MYLGELVEYGATEKIFTAPDNKRTEQYITGRLRLIYLPANSNLAREGCHPVLGWVLRSAVFASPGWPNSVG